MIKYILKQNNLLKKMLVDMHSILETFISNNNMLGINIDSVNIKNE